MNFKLRTENPRKNSPKNGNKATKTIVPLRFRIGRCVPWLIVGTGILAAAGVGLRSFYSKEMKEGLDKRPVIQCKYDVKGETIIKNTELTPEEVRRIQPPKNCEKKLCKRRVGLGSIKRFSDCEPLTEERLAQAEVDAKREKKADIDPVTASLLLTVISGLMAGGFILGRKLQWSEGDTWHRPKKNETPANPNNQNVS